MKLFFNSGNKLDRIAVEHKNTAGVKTIKAAENAFQALHDALEGIHKHTLLPDNDCWMEEASSSSSTDDPSEIISDVENPLENSHWTDTVDFNAELQRLQEPSLNAVYRLVYLTTIDGTEDDAGNVIRLPFANEDLDAFVKSKTTRNRTYRWFKLGMIPAAVASAVGGCAGLAFPSTEPRDDNSYYQATMITMAGIVSFGLGIWFTGLHPDISQDKLNEKVDRLNRVKEKLDEVARTLIIFCFHPDEGVRKLAQAAAAEININNIRKAATHSSRYAITDSDIEPSLKLLSQAVNYIQEMIKPEDHSLIGLIERLIEKREVI